MDQINEANSLFKKLLPNCFFTCCDAYVYYAIIVNLLNFELLNESGRVINYKHLAC